MLAYGLGRLIARGWIGREQVEGVLLWACRDCRLLADDGLERCLATLASGISAGMARPYHDIKCED